MINAFGIRCRRRSDLSPRTNASRPLLAAAVKPPASSKEFALDSASIYPTKPFPPLKSMRKYIAEFIGTFFLVLTIGCTVIPGAAGVIPPLAIRRGLMVMIFAGPYLRRSLQPAVTLAASFADVARAKDVLPYWIAQGAASIVAALVAIFLVGKSGPGTPIENIPAALSPSFCSPLRWPTWS